MNRNAFVESNFFYKQNFIANNNFEVELQIAFLIILLPIIEYDF